MLFDADLLQQQELVTLLSAQGADGEKRADHSSDKAVVDAKESTKPSANALFKKAAGMFGIFSFYCCQTPDLS